MTAPNKAHYEKHLPEATKLSRDKIPAPSMPITTFLNEGSTMLAFAQAHWDAAGDVKGAMKTTEKLYPKSNLTTLGELIGALAHAESLLSEGEEGTPSQVPSLKKRASELRADFSAAVGQIYKGGDAALDAKLRELKARGKGTTSAKHIATTLKGWVEVCKSLDAKLSDVGDFNKALLADASSIADQILKLEDGAAAPRRGRPRKGSPGAKERRDRIFLLAEVALKELQDRGQYAFRNDMDAAKVFVSEYRRTKSAEAYRRRVAKAKGEDPGPRKRRAKKEA
jgi:hypothetical protein